jgi:outer membrane protein OmpA-like peptidoglycan-associated protein
MNAVKQNSGKQHTGRALIAAAVASVILAACATTPQQSGDVVAVRAKLTALEADPNLAGRAPASMHEAEEAVKTAETHVDDRAVTEYRVYVADRKVEIARAQAETRLAEDQRTALIAQAQNARLDARTREVNVAKAQAADAKMDAADAKAQAADAQAMAAQQAQEAARARSDADAANAAAETARQQAMDLQTQINMLQAKVTDRGIVLTLGDVLFETGKSDLKSTAALERLVAFLNKYPDRSVAIEGYTDSVGSEEYNQALSERRANSVRNYLTGQGIAGSRLTATGRGKSSPVADNSSATGRQQNRRVEVIISNTVASASN